MRLALILALALLGSAAPSQQTASEPTAPAVSEFTTERLEQLVAPIALYPDALLAQILMASTYPLEIVEAARWLQKQPKLSGEKLEAALKKEDWDPSVKSLCGLPEVLKRMDENLDWTQDLGDAFLADQAGLMDVVQNMRRKALEAGNLKTSDEQKVEEKDDGIIVVESASPDVVYVPTYYPTVVYGSWSYAYWFYPPLYAPPPRGSVWFGFTAGVIWGRASWGGCHWGWGHTEIDIDIERHYEFTARVDRVGTRERVDTRDRARRPWTHEVEHRKGVGYRDAAVAQRFEARADTPRVTHNQARGYADRPTQQPATRTGDTAAARPTPAAASARELGQRSGTFTGARQSDLDRASSVRGSTSRASSAQSRGVPRSSAASRSSGAIRSGGMHGGGRR
jgi:hypothetical protein